MEGPHLLNAAVAAGVGIETIFSLEGAELPDCDAEVVIVTDGVLDRLAPTDHPRGPIAVFRPEPRRPTAPHAMVLWGLSDPGNAGTLIRTAAAFGVDIFVTPGTVDLWSPKVLRAASGAHFSVGFGKATQVSDLTSMGYRVIAAVATGGAWPDEVRLAITALWSSVAKHTGSRRRSRRRPTFGCRSRCLVGSRASTPASPVPFSPTRSSVVSGRPSVGYRAAGAALLLHGRSCRVWGPGHALTDAPSATRGPEQMLRVFE